MNAKEIFKRLMGKGSNISTRDDRGFPLRKATTDDLELEQYSEEDRRKRTRNELAEKRRQRFSQAWKYGGDAIKMKEYKQRRFIPKSKPKKTTKKNILSWK